MHVVSIVGARPQFVKASVVSRVIRGRGIREVLLHTGQHYDPSMSAVFFDELDIPQPDVNLGVGSGTHAQQTAAMMVGIETTLSAERPDAVMVYGDTNSTLAGALVAAKLGVPLAHVEAGLRSFDMAMPEEINRIVTDRLSNLLFCPTSTAVDQLRAEGMRRGVLLTGDVMLDATRHFAERAAARAPLEEFTSHAPGTYCVATVHRAGNTDDPERLEGILEGLGRLDAPVVLPMHPRTRSRLEDRTLPSNIEMREPVGYLAMLSLVQNADCVLTDSGGLQKEAVWLGVRCVTLRDETEWVETLDRGWNRLAGADADRIVAAYREKPTGEAPEFGSVNGASAAALIADGLERLGSGIVDEIAEGE